MCKATQISPSTVIAMYAASVRRNGSMMSRPQLPPLPGAPVTGTMTGNGIMTQPQAPRPNGFHVPCPVAPLLRTAVKDSTTNNAVVVVNVVNKSCPQHGTKAEFLWHFHNFFTACFHEKRIPNFTNCCSPITMSLVFCDNYVMQ